MIPQHTLDSLNRYVQHRIMPGGFLFAVLTNDLFSAVSRADSQNLEALPEIVQYIYNKIPSDAWGSRDIVWQYIKNQFYNKLTQE